MLSIACTKTKQNVTHISFNERHDCGCVWRGGEWGWIYTCVFVLVFVPSALCVAVFVGGDSAPYCSAPRCTCSWSPRYQQPTHLPAISSSSLPLLKPDCSAAVTSFWRGAEWVDLEFNHLNLVTHFHKIWRGGMVRIGCAGSVFFLFFFTECVCRGPRAPWCSAAAPGWRAAGRSRCTSYPSALPSGSCWRGKTVRGRKRSFPPILPMQAESFESTQTTASRGKKTLLSKQCTFKVKQ